MMQVYELAGDESMSGGESQSDLFLYVIRGR